MTGATNGAGTAYLSGAHELMKKYKRTNNDLQNIDIKLRSSNTNPTKNWG
jgi:hypothetical protein